jgi:hypothetical protein
LVKHLEGLVPTAKGSLAKSKKDTKITVPKMPPKAKPKKAPRAGGAGKGNKNGGGNGGGKNIAVSAPVAQTIANRSETRGQRMLDGGRTLVVTRKEFVKDIVQTTASTAQIENVLIASLTFPWSKQYAGLFENYMFEALTFEFIPLQATTATGFLTFAPDYDPVDAHLVSDGKQHLLSMDDAIDGNPWTRTVCRCTPVNLHKRLMLYTGTAPAGDAEQRQHSAGRLWIMANTNVTTGAVIGELWVSYTIRFTTPQIVPIKSGENDDFADSARYTGTVNSAPFGAAVAGVVPAAEGGIPATLVSSGTTTSINTWTFTQPWSGYLFVVLTTAAGISSITPSGTGDEAEITEFASSLGWFGWIDSDPGETFILTIVNTDISGCTGYFIRGADRRP